MSTQYNKYIHVYMFPHYSYIVLSYLSTMLRKHGSFIVRCFTYFILTFTFGLEFIKLTITRMSLPHTEFLSFLGF